MKSMKPIIHGRDHAPGGADEITLDIYFVLPISPAAVPDDYDPGEVGYVNFSSPWQNISAAAPATAYGLSIGSKPWIRLGCTGGEDLIDSLIFTTPSFCRPREDEFFDVIMGVDGSSRGTVRWGTDGTVMFLGIAIGGVDAGLAAHIGALSDAHPATAISVTPTGDISSTDVQDAFAEIDSNVVSVTSDLAAHLADTTAAHAASAISFSPTGTIASTDVQTAIAEVAAEASTAGHWELVMADGTTAPPVPVENEARDDWLYVFVAD